MSDEAEIIENPTSTPAAVSTGYQRQNTALVAARVGMDSSVVEEDGGAAVVRVSGPVDVNGVLYNITTEASLTPASDGRWYIYLSGSGPTYLTPTLTADPGTFDPEKNARYTAGGYRILNWVIDYYDSVYVIKKSIDGIEKIDDYPEIYTGTDDTNAEYPIGTYLCALTAGTASHARNSLKTLYYYKFSGNPTVFDFIFYDYLPDPDYGFPLNGSWSCKGISSAGAQIYFLFQRVS